jgi:CRP-like cAMP-binding protein
MQDFPHFASMAGFTPAEWQEALSAWHARTVQVKAGAALFSAGDAVRDIYLVTDGCVHLLVDDYWGNRSILSVVEAGHIFGAAYAFGSVDTYPMSAMAVGECTVLAIPLDAYRASGTTHPVLYGKAQQGFLTALADRSVGLIHTIEQVKQRTLRQKILAFLSYRSRLAGSTRFEVDLTQQQLADFLAADRSALARELSALRQEGILDYHGRQFALYLPREP